MKNVLLIAIFVLAFILRIYNLGNIPISLHGDEIGVGYNAYSLLNAGIDEYGKPWPFVFRADVTPLIFYATIPSIYFFGLTEFAVRIPSVVISLLSLGVIYLLVKEILISFKLFKSNTKNLIIPLLTIFLIAVSPWNIQVSRIAHDGGYGILFTFIGLFLFLRGIRLERKVLFLLSFVFFGFSFYSYHAPRLTSPLLLLLLISLFKNNRIIKKNTLYGILLFSLTVTPIVIDFLAKPIAQTRFGGINIFIREPDASFSLLKIPIVFVESFFRQLNPYHYFINSSELRYFQIQHIGLMYALILPLILFGIFKVRRQRKFLFFILGFISIALLPGALTQGILNAGRILVVFPMFEFLASLGFYYFLKFLSLKKKVFLVLVFVINIAWFLNQYFLDSQKRFTVQWQYGAKQVAEKALENETKVDKIIISQTLKQEYVYILFYGEKDPLWLQSLENKKRHSFIGYKTFGKYEFRQLDYTKDKLLNNTLIIGAPSELPVEEADDFVYGPTGEILYTLAITNKP